MRNNNEHFFIDRKNYAVRMYSATIHGTAKWREYKSGIRRFGKLRTFLLCFFLALRRCRRRSATYFRFIFLFRFITLLVRSSHSRFDHNFAHSFYSSVASAIEDYLIIEPAGSWMDRIALGPSCGARIRFVSFAFCGKPFFGDLYRWRLLFLNS